MLLSPPASAQDVQALQNQVDRLQRELTDLQRAVYQGGVSGSAASGGAQLPADSAARMEVRMSELEQSLRELRGQIEEMSFRIQRNEQRLDKLSADVEYRLTQLEGGTPVTPPQGQTGDSGSGAQVQGQAESQIQGQSQTGAGQATAPQAGTLGQISANDLARFEQNKPAVDSGAAAPGASAGTTQSASAAAPAQVELPEGSPEAQYNFALGLLRQTRFDQAEVALKAFLEKHPKHLLSSNAKYWLGETYYVRGDFQNAAVTFAEGFQEFPDSAKAPDNLLKLGMSLGQLGDKENACATFTQLQQRFPTAPANIQQKAQLERQRIGCQ
jgi:tol-pal system protein YbgF